MNEYQESGGAQREEDLKQDAEDWSNVQREYQKYCLGIRTTKRKETIPLPINKYKENRLVVAGGSKGKIMLRVASIHITPSYTSLSQQKKSLESGSAQHQVWSNPAVAKFWGKRHLLFERYDQGIRLDQESWYSVTPEAVAKYVANRISSSSTTVLDGFCGAGGDSIQLASVSKKVIANDIDPHKLQLLKNNSAIYQANNIMPTCHDFLTIGTSQIFSEKIDLVYMSPPWGGTEYYEEGALLPSQMEPPLGAILDLSLSICSSVAILLPLNTHIDTLAQMFAQHLSSKKTVGCTLAIQKIYFQQKLKFLLVMWGQQIVKKDAEETRYMVGMLDEKEGGKGLVQAMKERLGAVKTLNSLFQCQGYLWKHKKKLGLKQKAYFLHHKLSTAQQLTFFRQKDSPSAGEDKRKALSAKIERKQKQSYKLQEGQEKKEEKEQNENEEGNREKEEGEERQKGEGCNDGQSL